MKYIKSLKTLINNTPFYKLVQGLNIGDYVAIESKIYTHYEYEIGEIVDISDDSVLVTFNKLGKFRTLWLDKSNITKTSKYKKNIEEYLEAKKASKKYNL